MPEPQVGMIFFAFLKYYSGMWVENGLERLIGAELPKGVCVCQSITIMTVIQSAASPL